MISRASRIALLALVLLSLCAAFAAVACGVSPPASQNAPALRDDQPALQRRIDALTKTGGVLSLGAQTYNLGKPLTLPRTGYDTSKAVQIVGAGQYATVLQCLPTFPANRAAIEWATPVTDSSDNQILGQCIADFTIALPFGVDGVSAVRHVPFNKLDSITAAMHEWVQIDVERVTVRYTNAFNRVLFDFPNGFRFSTWDRVTGDGWQGLPNAQPKYDTTLLAVGNGNPAYPGEDSTGVAFSSLTRLRPVCNAGAWCQTFAGRAYCSSFSDSQDNGARYGTGGVAYHFVNSSQLDLRNLACEGQGSCTLKLDNCDRIDAVNITGGTPPVGAGPYQDSIIVCNSRGVRLSGHIGIPGAMPFSALGVHALIIDKDCRDCALDHFDIRANFDAAMPTPAARELSIDPAAAGSGASGQAVQAWGNIRQAYSIGNQ